MVSQASLTGESLPVRRCEGQSVYAGYEGVDGAEAESVKYNTHNKPNAPLEWEKLELPKEKQKTAGEYTCLLYTSRVHGVY